MAWCLTEQLQIYLRLSCCLFSAGYLFRLFFDPEEEDSMLLRNIGELSDSAIIRLFHTDGRTYRVILIGDKEEHNMT
jgi:hypothetical protein